VRWNTGLELMRELGCAPLPQRLRGTSAPDFRGNVTTFRYKFNKEIQLRFKRIPCSLISRYSSQFEHNYFTEMYSGSEAGSYFRLIDFVCHSNPGLRVMKKKKSLMSGYLVRDVEALFPDDADVPRHGYRHACHPPELRSHLRRLSI